MANLIVNLDGTGFYTPPDCHTEEQAVVLEDVSELDVLSFW